MDKLYLTEEYYTEVCKKRNLDLPVFDTPDLDDVDDANLDFMSVDLAPFIKELNKVAELDDDTILVTYAHATKSYTLWVNMEAGYEPQIICDINSVTGEIDNYIEPDELVGIDAFVQAVSRFVRVSYVD